MAMMAMFLGRDAIRALVVAKLVPSFPQFHACNDSKVWYVVDVAV